MGTPRWTLTDGISTYQFPINPNVAGSIVPTREIAWHRNRSAGYTGIRAGRRPVQWTFGGVIREQRQYDDFLAWLDRRVRLTLTTDLGQELPVRLTAFRPAQKASGNPRGEWRMTYDMECLIFPPDFALPRGSGPIADLTAPTGVTLKQETITTALGVRSVLTVSWTLVSSALGYDVKMTPPAGAVETRSALANTTSFPIYSTGVHTVTVTARSHTRTSTPTSASITIVPGPNIGSGVGTDFNTAPVLSAGPRTSTTQLLTWPGVATAISYDVEFKEAAATVWSTRTATGSPYGLTTLKPGITYHYRIRAKNGAAMYGPYSNTLVLATLKLTAPVLSLGPTTASTQLLVFTAVSGAVNYDVEFKESAATTWRLRTATGSPYGLTTLKSKTVHNYRVRARNGDLFGPWSNIVSKATL